MKFHVLTLFPDMIERGLHTSILGRAMEKGVISLETTDIRDFSANKFRRVDDYPYGGGAGMVIEAEPVYRAHSAVTERIGRKPRTIYLTPQGRVLNQTMVEEFALEEDLVLLCGHYEGIDDRVLEEVVTDYVSIGDYVLTGGELGAMVLIDAVSRFVPGVLSNEESSQFESLQDNLLEYPHYTRPEEWHGKKVPEVLLSGDHRKIESWRHEASFERTAQRRPDLLENAFRITGACDETLPGAKATHALTEGLTRYGTYLDLSRKKIRKQKNAFGEKDFLVLTLPGVPGSNPAVEQWDEYIAQFRGQDTPLVLIFSGVDSEQNADQRETMEQEMRRKGFHIVAVVNGTPSGDGDGIRRFSFRLRELIYTGQWKNEKVLASAETL